MLPGMMRRPGIAIVGAGNLGTALALALRTAGYSIEVIVARPRAASMKRARRLAERVGARVANDLSGSRAEVVWFCVPDGEIAAAAAALSKNPRPFDRRRAGSLAKNARRTGQPGFEWKGKIALHSSGALTSDELDVLRDCGVVVASVHPMMTFVRGALMRESRPALAGVSFAIEGDARAVRVARRVVKDLGGKAYSIRKADKAAYHAWGTFASPLFTALLATTERMAALAGVKPSEARRRMIPILRQTLANYAEFGGACGFSGPIVRGDADTIRRHLRVLGATPAARAVYLELARAALQYLPVKNKKSLTRILQR
jgi:predicted short-subunit dehydrogenase-like oxidoreductase (DUF2520 family)